MQQKPQTKTPRSAAEEKLWPPPAGRDGAAAAYRQTTEKLRLLESAVQQATDAIVITTAELDRPGPRIVYVNSAFTTLTGYTAEELVGRTPRILQGAQTERKELDRVRRTLRAGRPFAGEITNYRKDGTPYVVEWHLTLVRGEKGEITHWVAIQRDITERSRTEAALTGLVAEL